MYIHPESAQIASFASEMQRGEQSIRGIVRNILDWFNKNIKYSRLNAPYDPLQRSDIDILTMKAGTCGDYANLVVSVLICLGYHANYAYVTKDCYGDQQDHICAACKINGRWVLIDATLPYRKWMGYDCPHREYDLLTPLAFETKMKAEEAMWIEKANAYGEVRLAGLLYAPWVFEETVVNLEDCLESVFYLLILNNSKEYTLYVYYMVYNSSAGSIPVMVTIDSKKQMYQFSVHNATDMWDNAQWSQAYDAQDIPVEFRSNLLSRLDANIRRNLESVIRIAKDCTSTK